MIYEHLVFLSAISMCSLVRYLLRILAQLLSRLFVSLSFKSSLYIMCTSSLSNISWKCFLTVCGLSSHSLDIVFCRVEVFNFNEDQFIIYIFMDHAFGVIFLLIFIMKVRAVLVPKEMTIVFFTVILKNLQVIWRELTSYYVKSLSLTITFTLQLFTFLLEFFQFSHSDPLWPHELLHTRFHWPSRTSRVCSNSCPLSWCCHPTVSSSVTPFSSCPQSFPKSQSFPMS